MLPVGPPEREQPKSGPLRFLGPRFQQGKRGVIGRGGVGLGDGWGTHRTHPTKTFFSPVKKKVAFLFISVGLFSTLVVFFIYLEDYLCFINKPSKFPLLPFFGWAGRCSHKSRGGWGSCAGKPKGFLGGGCQIDPLWAFSAFQTLVGFLMSTTSTPIIPNQ